MKSIKAPRTSVSRSATSIPALLLLGTLSGTALAATEIQEPCPQAAAREDVLQAFIDAEAPLVRTVEASEPAAPTQSSDADSKSARDSEEAVKAPASANRSEEAGPEAGTLLNVPASGSARQSRARSRLSQTDFSTLTRA